MDVNMRRLFGSGEYLRARRLFDSSAKSSTLRFCVCHASVRKTDADVTQDERQPYARRTLDETLDERR